MTTNTTHDDVTTWRDLADQLTPEQVARFERQEAAAMKTHRDRAAAVRATGRAPGESTEGMPDRRAR
jgi:hypothetical protein